MGLVLIQHRCFVAVQGRGVIAVEAGHAEVRPTAGFQQSARREEGQGVRSDKVADFLHVQAGGDEFLLIMTGCTLGTIAELVEQLDANAPYILNRESDEVHCALSYGYAYAKGSYVYEELLSQAEQNMYTKKNELKELMQMPER